MPKILYAIQGTGNGHVARAREIIPILKEFGTVHIALGGDQSEVQLPVPVDHYCKGLTFVYNKKGGISYGGTLLKNNPFRVIREILAFPVNDYDIIINDFEFTTSWACKLRGKKCFGLGHQAAFQSNKVPRPPKREWLGELILKQYAPCSHFVGFHFDSFDDFIFRPVIRSDIRNAQISNSGHYTVYLPAYGDERIHSILKELDEVEWQVFSKRTKEPYTRDNVHFRPVDNEAFLKSFTSCEGILTSAGFEAPAEAIFMGKKLMVIPIRNQYEQLCNAEAMKAIGVRSATSLNQNVVPSLKDWVTKDGPINIQYPDETHDIIAKMIFEQHSKN